MCRMTINTNAEMRKYVSYEIVYTKTDPEMFLENRNHQTRKRRDLFVCGDCNQHVN